MTTDRQASANRFNARKSTGPRTDTGKAASSANARRHGLTAALDEGSVLSWYRVILDDADAAPEPFERNPLLRAAVDLARAEAHLQRVREAEVQWLLRPELPRTQGEVELDHSRDRILDELVEMAMNPPRRFAVPRHVADLFFPPKPFEEEEEELEAFLSYALNSLHDKGWDRKGFRLLRRTERNMERHKGKRQAEGERMVRTLARYRASAEARRRTVLRAWIDEMNRQGQETGP